MSTAPQPARDTLAVVLAGGNGTRLGELTRRQCKPALPFAGHFRNIDFTLSNCVHSQIRRIGVLTQYKAQTLIGHLAGGWSFLPRNLGEFLEIWPAQQRLHADWYAGTADAVRQNLDLILAQRPRHVLVLAGDHVYRMDYRPLLEQHVASGAAATIACVSVPRREAASFGVLEIDAARRVRRFQEKPAAPDALGGTVLASMGVYVFDVDYLAARLTANAGGRAAHDFGRDLMPLAVQEGCACAFPFVDSRGHRGYWRDVGTIHAYWQTHMDLLADEPPLDLYDPAWPVLTLPEQLPPARLLYDGGHEGCVGNSLFSAGAVVRGAVVRHCVLGSRVQVERDTLLAESVLLPGARVGRHCSLWRVIVDCDTSVPDGTVISGADATEGVAVLTRETLAAASPFSAQVRTA